MQTFTGSVKWPLGEVREGEYGPFRSIAIAMDKEDAPGSKDGVVRLYRNPDHFEIPYLEALGVGERVVLVYSQPAKGKSRGTWNILAGDPESEPVKPSVPEPKAEKPAPAYKSGARLVVPISADATQALLFMFQERFDLLMQAYDIGQKRAAAWKIETDDPEFLWKAVATAFIGVSKEWSPNMVLEDGVAANEPAF